MLDVREFWFRQAHCVQAQKKVIVKIGGAVNELRHDVLAFLARQRLNGVRTLAEVTFARAPLHRARNSSTRPRGTASHCRTPWCSTVRPHCSGMNVRITLLSYNLAYGRIYVD